MKRTLLNGSDTWRITERYKSKIEIGKMDAIRRSLSISKTDQNWNQQAEKNIEKQSSKLWPCTTEALQKTAQASIGMGTNRNSA